MTRVSSSFSRRALFTHGVTWLVIRLHYLNNTRLVGHEMCAVGFLTCARNSMYFVGVFNGYYFHSVSVKRIDVTLLHLAHKIVTRNYQRVSCLNIYIQI